MKIEDITLRDYFAAKAMHGLTANPQYFDEIGGTDNERTARYAYAQADAMLAAREQEKTNQCGETCERAKLCAVCAAPLEQETPDQDGPGEEDGPSEVEAALASRDAEIERLRHALELAVPVMDAHAGPSRLAEFVSAGRTAQAAREAFDEAAEMRRAEWHAEMRADAFGHPHE